ncbi:HDOD domain-containing protein [Litorilituus sediminis]|uniref:HDOD domain-containing protein n=1 Tax=Litorilituus sediminis TaxID=718192 RepID=A0A4P6PB77_9GAMM|nr:HDOD domain-containing protein [Litorilituus sediminis]QBG36935.1 HDOD domain-containing protein [Litorilituus sediminis]
MNAETYADKASNIFVLSDSFIRIKELIDDESSTIDDISDVILLDPALAATVLKLANSSFFNYPGKIDTISKAVLVLGITEVYNLVIAYFTTEAFKAIDANSKYLDYFWLRSVDCALLIKFLGTHLNVANAERLFILGLLHNLGELVVLQITPKLIGECVSSDTAKPPWQKQREVLGFTFGECSAELLKLWQLPYGLFAPIRYQDVDDVNQYNVETQLLYIAKRVMTKTHVIKSSKYDELIDKTLLDELNLDVNTLAQAVDYCDLERLDMLSILSPGAAMVF